MLRKILTIMVMFFTLPTFAGVYEDALKSKDYVFLYIYTPRCRYCTLFNPRYEKLSKMYNKNYAFVKVNASDNYGYSLARKFRINGVPYVVLIKSKNNNASHISAECLFNRDCIENALTSFMK